MRTVWVAALACLMACPGGLPPARALPLGVPLPPTARQLIAPQLIPAKHHGHRGWYWFGRRHGWSRYAPFYELPSAQRLGDMPGSVVPPVTGSGQPPASLYPPAVGSGQPLVAEPAQSNPSRPASRPSIEWVNPEPAGR